MSVPKVWVLGVPGWEDDLAQAEDTVVFNTVEATQVRSEIDKKCGNLVYIKRSDNVNKAQKNEQEQQKIK